MPRRKTVACCREKTVLVAVYVERPRRRRRLSSNHQHDQQHNHQLHHVIMKQEVIQHKKLGGNAAYDRKAELLGYSRRLRDSATPKPAASTPIHPKPKPISPNDHQPTIRTLSLRRKQRHSRNPTSLSKWKVMVPRFLRSFTSNQPKKEKRRTKPSGFTTDKIKSIVKSFEVRKKPGFVSKLLSKLQKRR